MIVTKQRHKLVHRNIYQALHIDTRKFIGSTMQAEFCSKRITQIKNAHQRVYLGVIGLTLHHNKHVRVVYIPKNWSVS